MAYHCFALAECRLIDTAKVLADICNLSSESKTHQVFLYTIIIVSVAVVSVVLRITGKLLAGRISADDCIIVVAVLLTAVPAACIIRGKSL